mgnify:CR=1 FL=1
MRSASPARRERVRIWEQLGCQRGAHSLGTVAFSVYRRRVEQKLLALADHAHLALDPVVGLLELDELAERFLQTVELLDIALGRHDEVRRDAELGERRLHLGQVCRLGLRDTRGAQRDGGVEGGLGRGDGRRRVPLDAVADVCATRLKSASQVRARAQVTAQLTLNDGGFPLASLAGPAVRKPTSVEALELPPWSALALERTPAATVILDVDALRATTDADFHATRRPDTLAAAEDLEQLAALLCDLAVRLLQAARLDVEEVLFGNLGGCAREKRAKIRLAVQFAVCRVPR